jgi:hypothetical protein
MRWSAGHTAKKIGSKANNRNGILLKEEWPGYVIGLTLGPLMIAGGTLWIKYIEVYNSWLRNRGLLWTSTDHRSDGISVRLGGFIAFIFGLTITVATLIRILLSFS